MPMSEIISMRDALMAELNLGIFDQVSWEATALLARENGCDNIAAQIERYIDHYGTERITA